MRIGIISDTHDDLRALERAVGVLRAEDITTLLHCGDLCTPSVLEALSDFDTWIARGNMDRHEALEPTAHEVLGAGRLADHHHLTLAGQSVVLMHGHQEGELRQLISAGDHAYVVHGHTHRRRDQRIGPTHVVNPGALGGMRWQRRSFCILDLEGNQTAFIKV